MQSEIPYETIKQVALMAHQKGIRIMFNPAPACHIDSELMRIIDILVVNESEAQYLSLIHISMDASTNGLQSI